MFNIGDKWQFFYGLGPKQQLNVVIVDIIPREEKADAYRVKYLDGTFGIETAESLLESFEYVYMD